LSEAHNETAPQTASGCALGIVQKDHNVSSNDRLFCGPLVDREAAKMIDNVPTEGQAF